MRVVPFESFIGHTDIVTCVAISPGDKFVVTGSEDNSVRVWEFSSSKMVAINLNHRRFPEQVAFSFDGRYILSISKSELLIWDFNSRKLLHNISGKFTCFAISPDSQLVACGTDEKQVVIYDIKTAHTSHIISGFSNAVKSTVFGSSNHQLIIGVDDESAYLHDGQSNRLNRFEDQSGPRTIEISKPMGVPAGMGFDRVKRVFNYTVSSLVVNPRDNSVIVGSPDGSIRIWDINSRRLRGRLSSRSPGGIFGSIPGVIKPVQSLTISPDGMFLYSVDDKVSLWDLTTGRFLQKLTPHGDSHSRSALITSVVSASSPNMIITGSYDHTAKLSRVAFHPQQSVQVSTSPIQVFGGPNRKRIDTFSVSPDLKFLAAGHFDSSVELWELSSGKHVSQIAPPQSEVGISSGAVTLVRFSPDSKHIFATVSLSSDNHIRMYDVKSGNVVKEFSGSSQRPFRILISSNNQYLFALTSNTIYSWDIKSNELQIEFTSPSGGFSTISISDDDRYLLAGDKDKNILIWDISTCELVKTIETNLIDAVIRRLALNLQDQMIICLTHKYDILLFSFQGDLIRQYDEVSQNLKVQKPSRLMYSSAHNIPILNYHIIEIGFSKTGDYLCLNTELEKVYWETESGKILNDYSTVKKLSFSSLLKPNGVLIHSVLDNVFISFPEGFDPPSVKKLMKKSKWKSEANVFHHN